MSGFSQKVVVGVLALIFFIVANFTHVLTGLNLLSGCIQIVLNMLVFIVWIKTYSKSEGVKKFLVFLIVMIPVVMAAITITRVIVPVLI